MGFMALNYVQRFSGWVEQLLWGLQPPQLDQGLSWVCSGTFPQGLIFGWAGAGVPTLTCCSGHRCGLESTNLSGSIPGLGQVTLVPPPRLRSWWFGGESTRGCWAWLRLHLAGSLPHPSPGTFVSRPSRRMLYRLYKGSHGCEFWIFFFFWCLFGFAYFFFPGIFCKTEVFLAWFV